MSLYEEGMKLYQEHVEEVIARVMKSRDELKGNFAYLEDPDMVRERKIVKYLKHLLWRQYLINEEKEDIPGLCSKMCFDCRYKRYNFHPRERSDHWNHERPEGWYCQSECECK